MMLSAWALAAALLLTATPGRTRARRAKGLGRPARPKKPDPLATAATLELFAVCLTAGLSVPAAAHAAASTAPPALARVLVHAADLLALGSDPDTAWALPRGTDPDAHTAALLRLARRSASSGTALAQSVCELADRVRDAARHDAAAAAQRAGVLIAGPLGLCFLPAFVCFGIVPVLAGLAGRILGSEMW
ncbi:MAG: type II secretion system F family protein [Mycolicibacterium sp.]|jgi:pilus assembly protein TadC|nr:type II secretion system F family protein [Mycolicibacterium sp.]